MTLLRNFKKKSSDFAAFSQHLSCKENTEPHWPSNNQPANNYNSKKERLLILSHESACVVEADKYGIEKSRLSLKGGQAGLKQTVIKAEGVSLDKRGTLYIVGEPNQLFVFEKKSK